MNLYCKSCECFYETEGMKQITQWGGSNRKKLKTSLWLDNKHGASHEFLTPEESDKMRTKTVEEVTLVHHPVSTTTVQGQASSGSAVVAMAETEVVAPSVVVNPTPSDAQSSAASGNPVPQVEAREGWVPPSDADNPNWLEEYESWAPSPTDWFTAQLDSVLQDSGYMFAVLSNMERVFIPSASIQNKPLQHHCSFVIQEGDSIQVRMERNERHEPRWKAIETWFLTTYLIPEEESAEVIWWEKHHGMCKRLCGCWTFVTTKTAHSFGAGDPVIISEWVPSRSERNPGVVATYIRSRKDIEPSEPDDSDVFRI